VLVYVTRLERLDRPGHHGQQLIELALKIHRHSIVELLDAIRESLKTFTCLSNGRFLYAARCASAMTIRRRCASQANVPSESSAGYP